LERRLRAVIDTNLFISGLFARDSLSAQLQDLWINQEFELITSVEIIKEISRVLNYPRIQERFKPREENIRRFFRLIFRKAVISKDIYQTDRIVADPTDNKFLACALEKKADYIVSRDPHLRNLKHFHGIQIVDATTFINKV
jgi:putative PIN family toxin of toxin-antitoxin system